MGRCFVNVTELQKNIESLVEMSPEEVLSQLVNLVQFKEVDREHFVVHLNHFLTINFSLLLTVHDIL